jgi:transcriptional regulator with PAS, ATPase and Fis domain
MQVNWMKEFPAAITICDKDGVILDMNDKSVSTFEKDGGRQLIGKNLFDCHSQSSIDIIKNLLSEKRSHAYTIEKNGIHKFICQTPWFENGELKGLVELSIEIPPELPNFVR